LPLRLLQACGASGHPGVQIAVEQFGCCKERVASATC
jgi:hypothetical protein